MSNIDSRHLLDEANTVERLLGRKPKVPFIVATHCPDGTIQVLQTDPANWEDNRWKPFPSFFWLVCPRLKKLISQLEQSGFIREIANRLKNDQSFRELFLKGQKEVLMFRRELAKKIVPQEFWNQVEKVLEETNIAGSRNMLGVKCLHAHSAQTLAFGRNPIGEMVLEKIGRCQADVPCLTHNLSSSEEES